jgi:hypothetical protein
VPQVIKLLLTRSAADISLLWSLLYLLGTGLSFIYLALLGAVAAWIPIVVEICGCLTTITLKLQIDHTSWSRNQQLLLELELDTEQPAAAAAATDSTLKAAAGDAAAGAVSAAQGVGEVTVEVQLAAEQQGQEKKQPTGAKQQPLASEPAASAQQQQQQHPTLRQRTKKRVMLNVPLTAAEAAEAAAAVASGDIVLKLGLQLPHNPMLCSSLGSVASSAASMPRGDASGVVFYDSSDGAASRGPGPHWGSRTASARKVPWYLQTGISHHSVLPPASPRQAAAVPAAATVPAPGSPKQGTVAGTTSGSGAAMTAAPAAAACCCPHCGMPAQQQQQQQRQPLSILAGPSAWAFSNGLFSPSSPEVTPRRGGFIMRRQWSLFGRDAAAAAGDGQQEP